MPESALSPSSIVELLGGHPAAALGIDFDDDAQLGHWLIAVGLTGRGVDEACWAGAYSALDRAGFSDPGSVSKATPEHLEALLGEPGLAYPNADVAARKLVRMSRALVDRFDGSVDALARGSDGLEELGAQLAGLAPGFGVAGVARFLRPLRERWHDASEIPLTRDARIAATHLGWLTDTEDLEGEPGALKAAIGRTGDAPALADVEAALERLGSRACRRNLTRRCPLGDACPAREPT